MKRLPPPVTTRLLKALPGAVADRQRPGDVAQHAAIHDDQLIADSRRAADRHAQIGDQGAIDGQHIIGGRPAADGDGTHAAPLPHRIGVEGDRVIGGAVANVAVADQCAVGNDGGVVAAASKRPLWKSRRSSGRNCRRR